MKLDFDAWCLLNLSTDAKPMVRDLVNNIDDSIEQINEKMSLICDLL